jgi:NMT1-like family
MWPVNFLRPGKRNDRLEKRMSFDSAWRSEPQSVLRIGMLRLSDAAPLIMALEKKFFEARGLRVKLSVEPSWANIADKMTFGQMDAAIMLPPLALAMALGLRGSATASIRRSLAATRRMCSIPAARRCSTSASARSSTSSARRTFTYSIPRCWKIARSQCQQQAGSNSHTAKLQGDALVMHIPFGPAAAIECERL